MGEAIVAFLKGYYDKETEKNVEPTDGEIIEHVNLLSMSRNLDLSNRWAMICNGIFTKRDVHDIMDNLKKYGKVFSYWTQQPETGNPEAEVFLQHVVWLCAKTPKTVPVVLATCIASGSVSADQVLAWYRNPEAKVIPQWRGEVDAYGVWEPNQE